MKDKTRNVIVGIFVVLGFALFSWMVFKFGDLPALISRYDAREMSICFPHAPGIQENSPVLFCSYSVGKVIHISPPTLREDPDDRKKQSYQVEVRVAIGMEHNIPDNAQPKVFQRGLGGSFVEFTLEENPSETMLEDGAKLTGSVSEASEFISETTQHKLDSLINSLTELSDSLKGQLKPLPPDKVDSGDPNEIRANVTTVVMRLDRALKNLNTSIGDRENQRNFKVGMARFAALAEELRGTVKNTEEFLSKANSLIDKTSDTVNNIGTLAGRTSESFHQLSMKIQNSADQLTLTLNRLDQIFMKVAAGKGTAGRLFNDPRLYESLTDAIKNLNKRFQELGPILEHIEKHGLLAKPKKKAKLEEK